MLDSCLVRKHLPGRRATGLGNRYFAPALNRTLARTYRCETGCMFTYAQPQHDRSPAGRRQRLRLLPQRQVAHQAPHPVPERVHGLHELGDHRQRRPAAQRSVSATVSRSGRMSQRCGLIWFLMYPAYTNRVNGAAGPPNSNHRSINEPKVCPAVGRLFLRFLGLADQLVNQRVRFASRRRDTDRNRRLFVGRVRQNLHLAQPGTLPSLFVRSRMVPFMSSPQVRIGRRKAPNKLCWLYRRCSGPLKM